MRSLIFARAAVASLLLSLTLSASGQMTTDPFRTVVMSGDQVPGSTSHETFLHISGGTIDSRGNTTFVASVGSFDMLGIWSEQAGSLHAVIRQGEVVSGDPDGLVSWLIDPEDSDDERYDFLSSNGGIVAQANTAAGADSGRIWHFATPDVGNLVIAAGEPFDQGTLEFYQFELHDMNAQGQFLFSATLRQPGDFNVKQHSLWTASPDGDLAIIARTGVPAIGAATGLAFDNVDRPAAINSSGTAAFVAEVRESPQVNSTSASSLFGVWRGTSLDNLELVAVADADDPSQQIPSGYIDDVDIDNEGNVTFANTGAIWKSDNSGLHKVVTNRDIVELGPLSGHFSRFDQVHIADGGNVAFRALYRPDNSGELPSLFTTIWGEIEPDIAPVAYPGMSLSDGSVLLGLLSRFARNTAGQIVVMASLEKTTGETSESFRAILGQDLDGAWHTIVRSGQELEVAPGDFRTVQYVQRGGTINDRGQIGFRLIFDDNSSGFFVSSAVAVPEPTGCLLLFVGLLGVRAFATSRQPARGTRPLSRRGRGILADSRDDAAHRGIHK